MRRVLWVLGIVLLVSSALPVRADVVLLSQDLYSGSGSHSIIIPSAWPPGTPMETLVPTNLTHGGFPQDASNSITFGPAGMTITTNRVGNFNVTKNSLEYSLNDFWTVGGFKVQFHLDVPEAYHLTTTVVPDDAYTVTLVDDTTTQTIANLINVPDGKNISGTLQPGDYTFSGVTLTDGPQDAATFSFSAHMSNVVLTVVPEPGTGMAALLLLLTGGMSPTRRRSVTCRG
jgi:hypothetical protein